MPCCVVPTKKTMIGEPNGQTVVSPYFLAAFAVVMQALVLPAAQISAACELLLAGTIRLPWCFRIFTSGAGEGAKRFASACSSFDWLPLGRITACYRVASGTSPGTGRRPGSSKKSLFCS